MTVLPAFNPLVASAAILPANRKLTPQYDSWQEEAWTHYDGVGEFEAAVSWKANALSRVRLLAAEVVPGGDEPVPIDKGPAADLMERFAGGTGGQAAVMKSMTVHLSVPGEGWLAGETGPDGEETWRVYSADELRVTSRNEYQVREGESERSWRPLAADSVVVRFWDPHPRFGWRATSEAYHARGALAELDLINKRIVAEIISRLASNGILLYDKQRLSLGNQEQPEGADQVDRFAEILVDVAGRGIKDPTSPEATIPIPIGYDLGDATMADVDPKMLLQHVKISDVLDDKLLGQRESAVRRVATELDMPADILLGLGGMNHWGAWQVEDTGLKLHISPRAELITHAATKGYLEPGLKAIGEKLIGPNGGRIVVWYDVSELSVRPDRSGDTVRAYDRGEVPGRVLRREIGLSEDGDAPTPKEYQEWLTKFAGRQPLTSPQILADLGGPVITPTTGGDDESEIVDDLPADGGGEGAAERDVPVGPQPPDEAGDLSVIPVDELRDRVAVLAGELERRDGNGNRSGWFEHTVPLEQRVTPERRDSREPATAP